MKSYDFEFVTFDCYGTLIDWETGILKALEPFLKGLEPRPGASEILSLYAELESQAELTWKPYRMVLQEVMQGLSRRLRFPLKPGEEKALVLSLPYWMPFPETNPTLKRLQTRGIPWAIISNIDRDLLEATLKHLNVRPNLIVTAEEARAYKPQLSIFKQALQKIGLPREKILHVGQSLFHDIAPARSLGLATCWVRRPERDPYGATPPASAEPDFVVSRLDEICSIL